MKQRIKGAWWLPVAVPALFTAAAWVIQVFASEDLPTWGRTLLIIAGSLSALLAFLVPVLHAHNQRKSRAEEIARYREKMHDILIPASLTAGEAVAAPGAVKRREVQARLEQMIVDLAAEHIGPERSRSCYFRLEGVGPDRKAVRRTSHGRAEDQPRAAFEEGTPEGTAIMKLIDEHDATRVEDTTSPPVPGLTPTSKYRTFICAAVFAGDMAYGVLTVDSLKAGDLTKDDLDLVRVLAQILGAGLAARS